MTGVTIGYCHPENVSGMFTSSLMRTLMWDAQNGGRIVRHGDVIGLQSSPRIAAARNQIVDQFLSSDSRWLFMVDADMTWERDAIHQLVACAEANDFPMLGGLAFVLSKGTGKIEPTLKVLTSDNPFVMETIWDYPENSVVKISATGCACILLRRDVLTAVKKAHAADPYPWFAESQHAGVDIGEDVTFFLRANTAGFPLRVHTGVEFGHMKATPVTSRDYLEYRRSITRIGEDAHAQNTLTALQMAR